MNGAIQFDKVDVRYASHLPFVLRDLSFSIKPGEKVGVIGRTGAGKSTLSQALFRMVELESGRIMVDERDIRHMGLDTVRKAPRTHREGLMIAARRAGYHPSRGFPLRRDCAVSHPILPH